MLAVQARADAWLPPGDEGLRSDLHLLSDAGILRGPTTSWPISWPDIARDVLAVEVEGVEPSIASALLRVQRLARDASRFGFAGFGLRAGAAYEPSELRGFADAPRAEGEVQLRAHWLSEHVALNLQGGYAANPADGQAFRADGSYLGVSFGNYMLSAGLMERWWGPGWDNSLILSTNARPIPSVILERNYAEPFQGKWLAWIGPWRASIAMGREEASGVPVEDVRFFAARVNFKPRPWLEFGLSRTAQWCGGGRTCDWTTFKDMVLGHDNQVTAGMPAQDQPGNQMAGYDMRLRSPWRALRLAFYSQWIGEDEAGGLPSKFIGQFGLETWGSAGIGTWRLRAEFNGTACNFTRQNPEYGCAYRNSLYPQGYTYQGRVIGSSLDNDSSMFTLAGLLSRPDGETLGITIRRAQINRDGGGHAISEVPLDVDNVELRYSRGLGVGKIGIEIGYEDPPTGQDSTSRIHGFVTWQQGF